MDQGTPGNFPDGDAEGVRVPMPSFDQTPGVSAEPSVGFDPMQPAPSYLAAEDAIPAEGKKRARTRIAVTVGLVVAVVGIVAGVGLSGEHGTPVSQAKLLRLIHSASSALNRAPSSTFTMTMTISADGQKGSLHLNGVTNIAQKSATFTMSGLGINQETRSVNGVSYTRMPSSSIDLTGGKPWLGLHSLKPTPEEQQLRSQGPAAYLKLLPTVNGTIYDEGQQTVRGVKTTEYSFHADLLKLLGNQFVRQLGSGATPAQLKSLGFDSVPMKLWLDKQGVPREMDINLKISVASHTAAIDEVAYITPSYRVVKVTAPPASQVYLAKSYSDFHNIITQALQSQIDPSQLQGS